MKLSYSILFSLWVSAGFAQETVLIQNVTLIDGTGKPAQKSVDVLIDGDRILKIGKGLESKDSRKFDMKGKTMIPSFISAHTHVGTLKGNTSSAENYTRENILRQLEHYQGYGINSVLVMGTDRPLIFENGLRDSTVAGLLPGARLFSAGYGFNVPDSNPGSWMNLLLRPESEDQVPAMMNNLAAVKPTTVKMWVDDHGGKASKMKPEIYSRIISEAHKRNISVTAHLFYVEDAKKLVMAGLDIIGHSIRDQEVDDELLKLMKEKNVTYIPTLTLDHYAYIYADQPEWMSSDFFKRSLEPGVYEMISDKTYQDKIRNSPDYEKNKKAAKTALINLKKVFDAGIIVALGTDSGAFPIRPQGFSEHYEMELMVQAGIKPLDVIRISTLNAARVLGIDKDYGSIEIGKKADFVLLEANPLTDIMNTRKIEAVWKNGKQDTDLVKQSDRIQSGSKN
ncbi:amidohydrolase family protein [Dyadobacter sp. CY312]|uniref:amidohydrolase family protein n=1 Tax=Dyadobacter sp. CY312 TaxID=2907303 RepID=UPI001F3CEC5E|nr:amidohydrolase family protein [Dyadobacter sp. CY312]MCE7039490.1 amidohydrolase family protein [Dyadobacter sp. CY312]